MTKTEGFFEITKQKVFWHCIEICEDQTKFIIKRQKDNYKSEERERDIEK